MMPVKKAEVSAMTSVNTTMPCDGPSVRAFVRRRAHRKQGLTAKTRNSTQPRHVKSTQRAVIPLPALTKATHSARRIQPTTSLPTPAESTMMPTGVDSSFSSVRIRQSTGKACPC